MSPGKRFVPIAFLLCLLFGSPTLSGQTPGSRSLRENILDFQHPKLVVVISIDQFRADYLRRMTDLFLPAHTSGGKVGGFKYLMSEGCYFVDAHYSHFPLSTGPGHAAILTGAPPSRTGIVANEWWSKKTHRAVYCVDDPIQHVVGAGPMSTAKPMGPHNLRSTTVGDELKLATNGNAKVVTISLKDRASILLGGHAQDLSIWFDDADGRWISSSAFCRTNELPSWVRKINDRHIPDSSLGSNWTFGESPEIYKRATEPYISKEHEAYRMGAKFPHSIGNEKNKNNYHAFTLTPNANEFVLRTAEQAVEAMRLGTNPMISDLLAINLATNDYVGHAFGPYSPEALDVTVHTDQSLSEFFNFLDRSVPGGLANVVIVVTADHGVAPATESDTTLHISSGRVLEETIQNAAAFALESIFGNASWLDKNKSGQGGFVEPYLYLDDSVIGQYIRTHPTRTRAEIESVAANAVSRIPGIYTCYTEQAMASGAIPLTGMSSNLSNGYFPGISGDIAVIPQQGYFFDTGRPSATTAEHGTPYSYDTHVPILIAGFGIRSGLWTDRVSPLDIAPTLCTLLGIESPSGCEGRVLTNALR